MLNRSDLFSLRLHEAYRAALLASPELLSVAQRNIARSRQSDSLTIVGWADRWAKIIERPQHEWLDFLIEINDRAQQYRSCSPFAGVISQKLRAEILRGIEKEFAHDTRAA